MNLFDQFGGYPASAMLLIVIGAAFSTPFDEMSRATRWTARLATGALFVAWLFCVAEEALS